MNQPPRETPSTPGVPTTPRSLATHGLLVMAQELLIARFALMRCLERLDLVQVLEVFEEVSETCDAAGRVNPPRLITPRDEKL